MAQRKELTWRQLRVGLLVGIALVVLVVGIFFISGRTHIFESSYTLLTYFPEAEGLHEGAAVQLAGVPVGNVQRIRLSRYTDPGRAVEVVLKISKRFQKEVRANSKASISTFGLLGESFVDVTRGTPPAPVVPPGGELAATQQADIQKIEENANEVLANLNQLGAKLNDVTQQITTGKGTIGKFIYDPVLFNRLNNIVGQMQDLMNKISRGQGTVGELVSSDALARKLNATVDHANQMMDQIQHGNGTLAKFMNDPTAYNNFNQTMAQARDLMAGINDGKGSLGKFIKDPELYDRFNQMASNIDVITGRMAAGKGSLGMLSTNTALYTNLNDSAQSLREFLDVFRKTPKKYLTFHVHIF
ncbi:MAG: MlaD family protein [Terriglobia bacterium]